MTRLLASVKSVQEARIALANGADIIDCKDPAAGALGALPVATVADVAAAAAGARPVSATVGDLPMHPDILADAVNAVAGLGVEYVKVGLFPSGRQRECVDGLARQAVRTRLVGVLFADGNPDFGIIRSLARAKFDGVMLDTADKAAGGLCGIMCQALLTDFVEAARAEGLMVGLAGGLRMEDIPDLLALRPDYLGFRGALCAPAGRNGTICGSRVSALHAAIHGSVAR